MDVAGRGRIANTTTRSVDRIGRVGVRRDTVGDQEQGEQSTSIAT